MTHPSLEVLEERIGYRFKDRYLLECALTHTSFANEQKIQTFKDYERIEFLGDAVLEMLSSEFLFRTYPGKKEGELTKLRASLVCEPALAYCARDLSLGTFIRLGRGEEASGGREKDSIISDVMEALIGAMYLDSGDIEVPRRFILQFILSDLEDKQLFYDSKSILQERAQQHGEDVRYEILEESGPGHKKRFRVAAIVGGRRCGVGEGRSKKAAEQQAAYAALVAGGQTT
ncbi:MAG: ribonuclease III [Eubacteriales bacterium]|nr:ribonuclease III [Sarcina sp.]MBR2730157.1 ribonuclease III [Lachnospiraceae bacterium]MDO4416788.1 ribonuclease III [Eubacteriales bacterium]